MPLIFVSYRRDDSAYVAASIKDRLEQHFGRGSVFFDIDTIPLGTDFRQHIASAVGQCDVLLAIVGDRWSTAEDERGNRRLDNPTDEVRLEIEAALQRDIPVIPVLVGGARIPLEAELPDTLQGLTSRNPAEVRAGRDLQQHLTRLVEGVESATQSEPEVTTPAAAAVPTTPEPKPPSEATSLAPQALSSPQRTPWMRLGASVLVFMACLVVGRLATSHFFTWDTAVIFQVIAYGLAFLAAIVLAYATWCSESIAAVPWMRWAASMFEFMVFFIGGWGAYDTIYTNFYIETLAYTGAVIVWCIGVALIFFVWWRPRNA